MAARVALLLTASALTVSCTRYVDAVPVASQELLTAGAFTSEADCTPVDAPLTDIEPVDDGEPILRIPQPDGWDRYTEMDSDLFRFTMTSIDLASDNFAPTVVVTLESKSGKEDPTVVFESQRESLEIGFGATDLVVTEQLHCGLPAELIEYTTPPIGAVGALPARVLIAVMHTDDRTYAVTVTSQTDDPRNPQYESDTDQIIGGFQILPPEAG
ncbi:LpqN/LpqT family lipoprotein [Mycobacterium sp. MS1601]|uniref:LpqN/LpqT family lipoprotein n=1 Tax=Mycobacterium sp. MS1601 TaxID=1936029 RepID=UPI001F45E305|nr:LpqN/LpqT family lipoprotein [Mycobacterium sp. MS1601]